MFAEGYGGWASAFQFLRIQHQLPCQIIGIEDDFETALAYSLNHSATIIDGLNILPRGLFKSTTNDFVIHGNVRSRNWWDAVAVWSPHIVTISSPCPPWTGASRSPGLHSSQGMLLPEALAILRIFRPPLVAIEQVHGFATHSHRRHCIGVLKSSGYEIAFAKVVDSAGFGACHRLRWLCVAFRRNANNVQIRPIEMWPEINPLTPQSINAVMECFDADEKLHIDEHTLDIASDFRYVPKAKKCDFLNETREAVLSSRCFGETEQHPTFMAQYGNQQNLNLQYLEEKGLFAHFFKRATGRLRFLHPLEIAMMHLSFGKFWVPNDYGFAWKLVGNCITLPHALLLAANMVNMLPDFHMNISVPKIFGYLFKRAMNGNSIKGVEGSCGTLYFDTRFHDCERDLQTVIRNIERLRNCLTGQFLPKQMCWNPIFGISSMIDGYEVVAMIEDNVDQHMTPVTQIDESQSIDDTQLFTPMLKVVIELPNLKGDFWVAGDFPLEELKQMFGGHFEMHLCNDGPVQCRLIQTDMNRIHDGDFPHAIMVVQDSQLTVIKGDQQETLSNQLRKSGIDNDLFDIFGVVHPSWKVMPFQIVVDKPFRNSPCYDVLFLLAAFKNVAIECLWFHDCWELRIKVSGDCQSQQYVAGFWKNLTQDSLQSILGVRTRVESIDDAAFVVYSREKAFIPIPPQSFALALSVSAAKAFLESIRIDDGIGLQIKWLNRTLWSGSCNPNVTVECIADLLTFAFLPSHAGVGIRLITAGKTYYNIELKELRENLQVDCITFHLVVGLHGGAGVKDNQKTLTKNSIATTLLEQGYAIEWVGSTVEQMPERPSVSYTKVTAISRGQAKSCKYTTKTFKQISGSNKFRIVGDGKMKRMREP